MKPKIARKHGLQSLVRRYEHNTYRMSYLGGETIGEKIKRARSDLEMEGIGSFKPSERLHVVVEKVGPKPVLVPRYPRQVIRIHRPGSETKTVLSFGTPTRTMKVFRSKSRIKELFPEIGTIWERFNALQDLAGKGALLVKPLTLKKGKNGELIWTEEWGGYNVASMLKLAEPVERKRLGILAAQARQKLEDAAAKHGYKVDEAENRNLLYNPRTGELKFTDVVLTKRKDKK